MLGRTGTHLGMISQWLHESCGRYKAEGKRSHGRAALLEMVQAFRRRIRNGFGMQQTRPQRRHALCGASSRRYLNPRLPAAAAPVAAHDRLAGPCSSNAPRRRVAPGAYRGARVGAGGRAPPVTDRPLDHGAPPGACRRPPRCVQGWSLHISGARGALGGAQPSSGQSRTAHGGAWNQRLDNTIHSLCSRRTRLQAPISETLAQAPCSTRRRGLAANGVARRPHARRPCWRPPCWTR
jgi:hypothetical protein